MDQFEAVCRQLIADYGLAALLLLQCFSVALQGALMSAVRRLRRGNTPSVMGRSMSRVLARLPFGSVQRVSPIRGRRSVPRSSRRKVSDGTESEARDFAQVELARAADRAGCTVEELRSALRGRADPPDTAGRPAGPVGDDADSNGAGAPEPGAGAKAG